MKKVIAVAIVVFLTWAPSARAGKTSGDKMNEKTLDLAAAYVLEGMFDEARKVLESFPEGLKKKPEGEMRGASPERQSAERIALEWSLVHEMLQPDKKDAFDLLTDIASKIGSGDDAVNPIATVLWQKIFARYAKREEFRSMGAYVLRLTSGYLDYRLEHDRFEAPAQQEAAAAQRDEIARELCRLDEGEGSTDSPASMDPIASMLKRLLETPRLVTFHEAALPSNVQAVPMTDEKAEAQGEKLRKQFSLPDGFEPVRVERDGAEAVAVGVSQDYDPVGEISRGAYWVLRSHDGGKSWGRPLYTGLRIEAPYVVRPASNLPLLAGDRLRVDVIVRELDE